MIDLKHVLVPSDFSQSSDKAVRYGVAFARAFHARLHLLHVELQHGYDVMVERERALARTLGDADGVSPPSDAGEQSPPAEVIRKTARDLFSTVVTEQEHLELDPEYVLRVSGLGGPYVEIVRYAKERNIDVIIMGTHGRGFVAHMLMGSVAEKVVRKAPCPVLTVHHPEHEFVLPDISADAV